MLPVQTLPTSQPLTENQLIQRAATNLNTIAQRERDIATWTKQIEQATQQKGALEAENVAIKAAIKGGTPFPPPPPTPGA